MSSKEKKSKEDKGKKSGTKTPESTKPTPEEEDDLIEEEPEEPEESSSSNNSESTPKITEIPLKIQSEPPKKDDLENSKDSKESPPESKEQPKSEPSEEALKKATKSAKPTKSEIKAKLDSTSTIIKRSTSIPKSVLKSKIELESNKSEESEESDDSDADSSSMDNSDDSIRAELEALKHQIITGENPEENNSHPHIERAKSEKIVVKIQIGDKIKEEVVSPHADVFCVVCRGYDRNEKRYCYRYLDQLTIFQAEKFQNFLIKYGCMCGEQTDIIITLKTVLDDLNNAFPIHIRKFEDKFIEYFHKKIVIPSIHIQT